MKKRKILILLTVFFFALGFVSKLNQVRAEDSFIETHRENISDGQPDLSEWVHGEIKGGEITENGLIPQIQETVGVQLIGMPNEEGGPVKGGVMRGVTDMIASTYSNPPASGVYYAYDILGAAPAYAANGIGFSGLQPILPIWKAFRNLAYAVFAIAMLLVGLMIMFRVKISPQVVLTLENALPRMIGVLVLITFSYAIAGFMIDLMYVMMALGVNILASEGVSPGGATATSTIHSGFWSLIPPFVKGFDGMKSLGGSVGYMTFSLGGIPVAGWITGFVGGVVGAVLMILVWVIIATVLLFKLLIALIKSYVGVITSVIFAPLVIATGVIPGKNGFGNWLKSLIANLSVFPAVLIILIISTYILDQDAGGLWYPPLMGPPEVDFLQGGAGVMGNFVRSIIGMGFLFIIPNVPNMIKKAMGIEDSGIGGMIGQAFAPTIGVGKAGVYRYGAEGLDRASKFAGDKLKGKWPTRATTFIDQAKEFAIKNRHIGDNTK